MGTGSDSLCMKPARPAKTAEKADHALRQQHERSARILHAARMPAEKFLARHREGRDAVGSTNFVPTVSFGVRKLLKTMDFSFSQSAGSNGNPRVVRVLPDRHVGISVQ
ncbi:MAG: hypothetical protein LBE85_06565, partial [Candidatus Accumulibacter sp.]|nr:hypothetical protein [Accumulibacter sp.]